MSPWGAMPGGVVSCTVIVKPAVALLPAASVAEVTTGVSPSGNTVPEGGVSTVPKAAPFTSFARVVKLTAAPAPLVASITRSGAGMLIAGAAAAFEFALSPAGFTAETS